MALYDLARNRREEPNNEDAEGSGRQVSTSATRGQRPSSQYPTTVDLCGLRPPLSAFVDRSVSN